MAYKRSRAAFEADAHAPYALFGTPLPDENNGRDDGSYLPLWKQDVRDEKGRRRLHGAFTGGWSAGYFNTVGSKEGWTPSTFLSSRTNRRKDDAASATIQKRAEEYMDEEDLVDAAEAQTFQTAGSFSGLGASTQEDMRAGGILDLFRCTGDTKGLQLLRKMGWKDGQGVGPKVRRNARLGVAKGASELDSQTYLFAPDDTTMIQFCRKTDRNGLGHQGGTKRQSVRTNRESDRDNSDDDDDHICEKNKGLSLFDSEKMKAKSRRGAFGVGVLNDTGSDEEEDPYEMGPKIRYNQVIGGDKKKKKKKEKANAVANPSLKKAPVFLSKTARAGNSFRRCHDGRLPLNGFVLANVVENLSALLSRYAPPTVPNGWKSSRDPSAKDHTAGYKSTADAARASTLDSRSRAALLGEKSLPGKSVFDYISSITRDKLAAASGNAHLPPGLGEVPSDGHAPLSEEEQRQAIWEHVPRLDQQTAAAALSRSSVGPYADDEAKRGRYRRYLISQANPGRPVPEKPPRVTDEEYLREMNEFFNCARIFKPMTGFMASRFTTSKSILDPTNNPGTEGNAKPELLSVPETKVSDPAEDAARMGMFGTMTRSVCDFYPTRLLCKRFNVRAPAHSTPNHEADNGASSMAYADRGKPICDPVAKPATPLSTTPTPTPTPTHAPSLASAPADESDRTTTSISASQQPVVVDPEKNDAVEGKTANADILRAIFGDSDSE